MRTISTKLAVVLLSIAAASIAEAKDLYVAGPTSGLSSEGTLISVLGESIVVRGTTKFFIDGHKTTEAGFASALGVDSFVYAEIIERSGRLEATRLLITNNQYVAGATPVFVAGTITNFDDSVGRARIGNIEVDVTSLPASIVARLNIGDVVEINGTQPSLQQPLLLTSGFSFAKDVEPEAIGNGVSTQSISGSGVSAQSISGSGVSAQSISGSGVSAQSISGSGVSAQSISGSGVKAQSISGSGVSAQSISGSG